MIFESIRSGGCLSYLIGCAERRAAVLVDPALDQVDRYAALCAEKGVRVQYVLDTHTHADHFSAVRELAARLGIPAVAHRRAAAPFVDLRVEDGDLLIVGTLRIPPTTPSACRSRAAS
jgi:glyoxylase-like metal-dependent hydrolase (beta-lactamase superfamily II)